MNNLLIKELESAKIDIDYRNSITEKDDIHHLYTFENRNYLLSLGSKITDYIFVDENGNWSYMHGIGYKVIKIKEELRKEICKINNIEFVEKYFISKMDGVHIIILISSNTQELIKLAKSENHFDKALKRSNRRNGVRSLEAMDGLIEKNPNHYFLYIYNPEVILMKKERDNRFYSKLNSLPEIQKRRIYAHHIYGFSQTEIALYENVRVSSVSESINRGLETMKELIKNENNFNLP